ncbi:hypothetical protein ASG31_10400 [Chryseobacterium sp. Leaf404]|nr:hypothetical protein ASG31_10400 [Chryseobacterium sp. Leaf404]
MKTTLTILSLSLSTIAVGQVGINTQNPQGIFNIDGAKNNAATGIPTGAQTLDDFSVLSDGKVGIGTISPSAKLEINSGVFGTSGLKFSQINSTTSPTAGVANLGIDASGNVTVASASPGAGATTVGGSSTATSSFGVNGATYTSVPSSSYTFTIPSGGKALFLSYMLGVDIIGAPLGGYQFYRCELFLDGAATGLFLGVQEPGSGDNQLQFTVSGVLNVTAGSHTISARIIRIKSNLNGTNQNFETITSNFSAAYIN